MEPPQESTESRTPNPFIGLRPFDVPDSPLFFGRNKETYELLRRLGTLHFLAVLGPSGCGKSSLIRAGVLAALRDGYMADDGPWKIVKILPGTDPLGSWQRLLTPYLREGFQPQDLLTRPAEALDTSNGRIAILVDQFEDLFKFGHRSGDTAQVAAFIASMLATGDPRAGIYTILTMRSEYLAECALYTDFAEAVNEGLYLVPRMQQVQMRQAIVGPVEKGGGAIAVSLLDRLIDDAEKGEDGLPVLQHALKEMWPRRKKFEPLNLDLYSIGDGLGDFVDQHAERVYSQLGEAEKTTAESLFRKITELTPGGRALRRALPLDQVLAETGAEPKLLNRVIETFRQEGFLSKSSPDEPELVDIVHEAVARQWKRLGTGFWRKKASSQEWVEGWMTAEARERRAFESLSAAAEEWKQAGRENSYLFGGSRLARLISDLGNRQLPPGGLEEEFLKQSRNRERRNVLLSPKVLGYAFLAVLILGGLAILFIGLNGQAVSAKIQVLQTETAYRETVAKEKKDESKELPLSVETLAKSRIYPQVWNDGQKKQFQAALAKVKPNFIVMDFQTVDVGPLNNEIRYFRQSDAQGANEIAARLGSAGLNVKVTYVTGFENSSKIRGHHYELWAAKPIDGSKAQ